MESVQRELEPVKQEQQSEQPKDYFSWTIILYRG